MRNQRFYSYIGLCIVLASLTAFLALIHSSYLVAGITALGSFVFYTLSEKQANKTGKTRNVKITRSITKPLYEVVILGSILASNIVPPYLTVSVLSLVLLSQLIEEKMIRQLKKNVQPQLGQGLRAIALILTLILSSFNPFFIFYGTWAVGILAAYDLVDILYKSVKK